MSTIIKILVLLFFYSCTRASLSKKEVIQSKTDFHVYMEKKTSVENPELVKYIAYEEIGLKPVKLVHNLNGDLVFLDENMQLSLNIDTTLLSETIFLIDSTRIGTDIYVDTIVKPDYQDKYLGVGSNDTVSTKIRRIAIKSGTKTSEINNELVSFFYNMSIYSNCYNVRMPEVFYDPNMDAYYLYISGKPVNNSLLNSFIKKNNCVPPYKAKIVIKDNLFLGVLYADVMSMLKISGKIHEYKYF